MAFEKRYREAHRLMQVLILALITMYGAVPLISDLFMERSIPWAMSNALFSAALLGCCLALHRISPMKIKRPRVLPDRAVSGTAIFLIFLASFILFYMFPWHEDRISIGSKFASVARALWLYVSISLINSGERRRAIVLILTLVLMFVDQSRTFFLLSIFVLAVPSRYKYSLLGVGIFLAIMLAAVRLGVDRTLLKELWIGIFGEAYNASYAVGQTSQIELDYREAVIYLLNVLGQPILLPMSELTKIILPGDHFFSAQGILKSHYVEISDERIAPHGGWYLPASFAPLGHLGVPLMCLYYFIMAVFTRFLFNSREFPVHLLFFFVAIKATPTVYVNVLFYYFLVFAAIKQFRRLRI